jgi:hypothetical protein
MKLNRTSNIENKPKFLKFTLLWILVYIVFLIVGHSSHGSNALLYLLIIPIFLNEQIYKFLKQKINAKYFKILFSLMMCLFLFIVMSFKSASEESYLVNYLNENKTKVYTEIVNNINNKKYDEAINEAKKYNGANDQNLSNYIKIATERKNKEIELKQIEEQNKIKAEEIAKAQKQKELWLETIKNDGKLNVGLVISDMAEAYNGLLKLEPNNPQYIKRGAYWNEENNKQIKHNELVKKRFYDSVYQLRKYLKDNMNDPNSLEIIKESYFDQVDNILIKIEYTGKNKFNGTVREELLAKVNLETGKITIQ